MNFLYIDLSVKNIINIGFYSEKTIFFDEFQGDNKDLLLSFSKFLDKNNLKMSDFSGVFVLSGHGSFTSSRLASLMANIISIVENIPVFSVYLKPKNYLELEEIYINNDKKLIIPLYSGGPNIGIK